MKMSIETCDRQLALSLAQTVGAWQATQPRYPLVSQKQLWELLGALRRGEKLTVSLAIERYGIYALSQRCGELRNKLYWPIKSPMIALPNGKRVAEYSL